MATELRLESAVRELAALLVETWKTAGTVTAPDVAAVYDRWRMTDAERRGIGGNFYKRIKDSDPDIDAAGLANWRIVLGLAPGDAPVTAVTHAEDVPSVPPQHIDARLDWLIEQSCITQPRADRRLNGLEHCFAGLASQWWPDWLLEPARDIRLSETTRADLVRWVEECEPATGPTDKRLRGYLGPEALDNTVTDGWVRLLLVPPQGGA